MSASVAMDRGHLISVNNHSPTGSQRDYNHVSDPEYKKLRDLADQAYKKRQSLSAESQQAYKAGNGDKAKQLSEQAKKQLQVAEDYNFKAAEYVFLENNSDSDSTEIDLHGLYVKEAEYILKRRMIAGIQRHESVLNVIVGKGIHSQNGVAKIKPAVEELCQEGNFQCHIDPKNTGVLVVNLQNARIPNSWNSIQPLGGYSKLQNTYQQQQQPQYNQQQQPQYHQQQQQQTHQQPYHQQQQQQQQSPVEMLLSMLCACLNSK
ncbi:hypothetical protein WICPIJ_002218 [Wickerhamomyces pijperi]|uniref:Smr domain-containing protein n=1 Tax=Wickerhamomyces pijperi TaxID=599730 RepID=A0A9P8TQE2_WICPI|nr:hypothetical protein WICPIJ_002218 [Wickerhamomyces pijperi]